MITWKVYKIIINKNRNNYFPSLHNKENIMFSHIGLGVNDIKTARKFYDGVMKTLGCHCHAASDTWVGYGRPSDKTTGEDSLWIGVPINGQPATYGNGTYTRYHSKCRIQWELKAI